MRSALLGLLTVASFSASASAQAPSGYRILFASGMRGTYELAAPDGEVVASGEHERLGFIEVGWWRGPGVYTVSVDDTDGSSAVALTLDGSEYDFHVAQDAEGHLIPVVWRESPEVQVRWVDDEHIELRNDTEDDLSLGTRSGFPRWEHRPTERRIAATERANRTYRPMYECGTGWGSAVVPAHGTIVLPFGPSLLPAGDYQAVIRFYDSRSGHVVATFRGRVVAEGPRGGPLRPRS